YSAAAKAGETFALGTAGGGFGATTVNLQGGLGSASAVTRDGHTVGALVVVNACGSVNVGAGPHFWAAPFEADGEFGGLGCPSRAVCSRRDRAREGCRAGAISSASDLVASLRPSRDSGKSQNPPPPLATVDSDFAGFARVPKRRFATICAGR